MLKHIDPDTFFDIVEFCKATKIQISLIEYLRLNPKELEKLIKYVQGETSQLQYTKIPLINLESSWDEKDIKSTELSSIFLNTLANEPIESPLVPDQRPEPFYVSLFINGYKLNNCIINSEASDNIMPFTVAKALGLSLTKTLGKCYSMDSKQIHLLGQIKDAQVALVDILTKE